MGKCDYSAPWYHGSPEELDVLRAGSWVTQVKEMARAFSHRPTLMSLDDDCEHARHDGKLPGYLYAVSEVVGQEDVTYLRDTAQTHWQTRRDLRLRLVAQLPIDDPPQLSEEEIASLRQDIPKGATGFVETPAEIRIGKERPDGHTRP